MKWWFKQQLYTQILICIVIGALLGLIFGEDVGYIQPFGDIFIRLLKMLIVPLTFFTLISGITRMEELRNLRSVGGLTLLYFAATSLIAGTIGMVVALVIQPGKGENAILDSGREYTAQEFDFVEKLVNSVPENPVAAMASADMLQIIVFSIILGIGLLAISKQAPELVKLVHSGADLMIKVTEFVMLLAPYGILALVANMVATLGADMLTEVLWFIIADYISMIIILVVLYPIILKWVARINPIRFYRHISPAMLVAASTTSSGATLPVSMRLAEKNLGAPENLYGFTLPLGVTVNMDGMAAAIGVVAVFAANLHGEEINAMFMVQVVFLTLVLSVSTAGIKSSGAVMSAVLLETLGLPLMLIPILYTIWPIIDIGHTTCNITGDLCGTMVVGSRLKLTDKAIFDGEKTKS
ncbi:MAG: dicarboxylate/amino acid:cation symporter [Planctomycetes bacterium]|nr:dicarboxylate/amino acid:cation symporter [Planctomycetota bacterium]